MPSPGSGAKSSGAAVGAKTGKAYLKVYEPGTKDEIAEFKFQFNPKELSWDRASNWKEQVTKKPKKSPPSEYTGPSTSSMSVEVFLDYNDRPAGNPVWQDLMGLFLCLEPTPKSIQQNHPTPPTVNFGWGKTVYFVGFLESVSVRVTLFSPEGEPLRATVTLKMKELKKDTAGQNPTSGALAALRSHTVVEGDSLASIAYNEYGDPGLWRAVAETNRIDDPLRLRPGTSLLLPDIEEASAYR